MNLDEARARIEAAIGQYGGQAVHAIELVINEVRADLGAAAVNELIDEFDLELRYNIAPLTRIIHERFCCNRGFAAATSWHAGSSACQRAGSPLGRSMYCFKYASLPRGSSRPSRMATARFRDEPP